MISGFYRVSISNDKLKKNYVLFKYQYAQDDGKLKVLSNTSLKKLEEDVLSRDLEWKIIDNERAWQTRLLDNALTSLKKEYEENKGDYECKIKKEELCIQNSIKNKNKLLTEKRNKKQVFLQQKNESISQYIESMYQISLNQGDVYNQKMNQTHSSTGFYLVSIEKCPKCKTGSVYRYIYQDDGGRKTISSIDLDKLEQRVKARGLRWEIINKKRAEETRKAWLDNKNKMRLKR